MSSLPLELSDFGAPLAIGGETIPAALVPYGHVAANYFDTLGATLVAGRFFAEQDRAARPASVVVNEAFVATYIKGQSPVGTRLSFRGRPATIVGVVADIRLSPAAPVPPQLYFLVGSDTAADGYYLYVRSRSRDAYSTLSALADVVRRTDPSLSLAAARSADDMIGVAFRAPAFYASLSAALAASALFLSSVGLSGLVSYSLSIRHRELAIRHALGASSQKLLWLVIRQAVGSTLAGVLLGLLAGWWSGAMLANVFFAAGNESLTATPLAAAVLLTVCLAACYVPWWYMWKRDIAWLLRAEC